MKKRFVITLLLAAVFLNGCGAEREADKTEINKAEEKQTECFAFTVTEIVDKLNADCLIDFTPIAVVDNKEKTAKIATYTSSATAFNIDSAENTPMMHFSFNYDNKTDKVSRISFFTDRDEAKAFEHYLYHVLSIAQSIDPNVNTNDISNTIRTGLNNNEFATYTGKNFDMFASCSGDFLNASFTAIEN